MMFCPISGSKKSARLADVIHGLQELAACKRDRLCELRVRPFCRGVLIPPAAASSRSSVSRLQELQHDAKPQAVWTRQGCVRGQFSGNGWLHRQGKLLGCKNLICDKWTQNPAPGVESAHARGQVCSAQVPGRAVHIPLVDPCAWVHEGFLHNCPWSVSHNTDTLVKALLRTPYSTASQGAACWHWAWAGATFAIANFLTSTLRREH